MKNGLLTTGIFSVLLSGGSALAQDPPKETLSIVNKQLADQVERGKKTDVLLNNAEVRDARADKLIARQESGATRNDAIQEHQEQQLRRFDAILDRWEKQQAEYQKYLDTLKRK